MKYAAVSENEKGGSGHDWCPDAGDKKHVSRLFKRGKTCFGAGSAACRKQAAPRTASASGSAVTPCLAASSVACPGRRVLTRSSLGSYPAHNRPSSSALPSCPAPMIAIGPAHVMCCLLSACLERARPWLAAVPATASDARPGSIVSHGAGMLRTGRVSPQRLVPCIRIARWRTGGRDGWCRVVAARFNGSAHSWMAPVRVAPDQKVAHPDRGPGAAGLPRRTRCAGETAWRLPWPSAMRHDPIVVIRRGLGKNWMIISCLKILTTHMIISIRFSLSEK